jgi:hypothetical protein
VLLDQPILIVGAMVVGPEFGPLAALCLGLLQRHRAVIGVRGVARGLGLGVQLLVNITAIVVAGVLTLAIQRLYWKQRTDR